MARDNTDPGEACGAGQVCANGSCAVSCPTGQVNCDGRCVDPLTDPNHCGAGTDCSAEPGTVCDVGQVCVNGGCECPAGWQMCAGLCDPHPVDTDSDGQCDLDDPCPLDNPDDTDGDGVCDSEDICPGFDDAVDVDGDGVPMGCDCDDADENNFPGNQEVCDGSDNNCNGIVDGPDDLSVNLVSFTDLEHDWASPYWTDSHQTTESVFGVVDQLNHVVWLNYYPGGLTVLPVGEYVVTFRIKRLSTDGVYWLDLKVDGGVCAQTVTYRWPASEQASAGWYETPPVKFIVVSDDCPVRFHLQNTDRWTEKRDYWFDWIKVRNYCESDADCDDGDPATIDACVNSGCDHSCQ